MTTPSANTEVRPLFAFFALSFLFAWGIWFGLATLPYPVSTGLVTLGAWSPSIAALLVTAWTEGRRGVTLLLRRVTKWQVNLRWYVLAVGGPAALALLAIILVKGTSESVPTLADVASRFGLSGAQTPWLFAYLPVIFLVTLLGGPVAEELGWRGYAQERLQKRLGPTGAGLLIGVAWSLWHLPLFIIQPAATAGIPLAFYLPLVTALGGLFGWLYSRTEGSVLLTMLMHAGVNFVLGALGLVTLSNQLLATFIVLVWLALGLVTLLNYLSRRSRSASR